MILLTLIFLLVDVVSKFIIDRYMMVDGSIKLVNNFIYITYARNTGAAWSILSSNAHLVVVVSFLIITALIMYLYKNKPENKLEKVAYSLILGGALGNFLNRLVCGYVIDFFDFKIFKYDYPIFNFADTFIVIGVLLLIIYTWRCSNGDSGKRKQSNTNR